MIKNRNINSTLFLIIGIIALFIMAGCQGRPSEETPIHLNPNMDYQPKYSPQASSDFFGDGKTMRTPVEGTVARGELKEDVAFWQGLDPKTGEFIAESPVAPTAENLERGRERFNIYCSVCHGQVGDGTGIVIKRGYMVPPSFHTDQIRNYPDGKIFDIITHGIRNMPPYADQIPVDDRWLIINYVRALQLSQNATYSDLPPEVQEKIK